MLSFSIISHRASSNRLPHRLSTWVWVVLYLFFLLIFLQKSSLQAWSHSFYLHVQATRIFITATVSWDLYLVLNSSLLLILHCPFSFVGLYIFLSIFLSRVINIFSVLLVIVHVRCRYNRVIFCVCVCVCIYIYIRIVFIYCVWAVTMLVQHSKEYHVIKVICNCVCTGIYYLCNVISQ